MELSNIAKEQIDNALKKCVEILKKYQLNEPIPVGDDLEFIKGILNAHPRRNEKIGVGIKHVTITRWMGDKKSRHFKLVRVDGTEEFFSYTRCIRGGTIDKKNDFLKACRNAVIEDMRKFRIEKVGHVLGFTVDHKAPWLFHVIVGAFAEEHRIDFDKAPVSGGMILDNQLRDAFIEYHRKRADFRVLSIEDHVRINEYSFNHISLEKYDN